MDMLTLKFRHQDTEGCRQVERKALYFDGFKQETKEDSLIISVDEIVDNWLRFSSIYKAVESWDGTYFVYENVKYTSPSDKTKIFEAMKMIYFEWLKHTQSHIVQVHRSIPQKQKLMNAQPDDLSNSELDQLIDLMLKDPKAREYYKQMNK